MLEQLLGTKQFKKGLKLEIEDIFFTKLNKQESLADRYAYLLSKDSVNKFTNISYKIDLEDIEVFLKY
ncbi:hypothetical protein KKG83_02805 [Candidatus Micrarchaeota archaeon]|nr:hypothetical protein [Candidatus Micrarchaeota archaeon]MBU2476375.1 hypothetical protein [Candidatus Micrarchaeota archaeon]